MELAVAPRVSGSRTDVIRHRRATIKRTNWVLSMENSLLVRENYPAMLAMAVQNAYLLFTI
jgi:hypothetical protein